MNSIKHRVLFVLIGAGLIPLVVVFFLMKSKTSEAVVNCHFEKLEAVTAEVARQVATTMDRTASDLVSLRSNPRVTDRDTPMPERVDEMKRLVKAYHQFSDITLYAPDGFMIVSTTDTDHPETEEFTKWFVDSRDNEHVRTSLPHRVNGQEGLHIKVYMPVRISGIEGVCVMKARHTFDGVWARTDGVDLGGKGEMILLDARGKILACENKNRIFENFDERLPKSFFSQGGSGNYVDPNGNEYIYTSVVLPEEETRVEDEWTLIALNPKSEVTASLRESSQFLYLSGGVTILIALILGSGLARSLTGPVKSAANAAKEVVKGNLDVKMPSTGIRELETMSNSFNSMIDEVRSHRFHLEQLVDSRTIRLRESQEALEESSAQLQATYESTQEGVLAMKGDGTILTSNSRLNEIFGFSEKPGEMPYSEFEGRLCECFGDAGFKKLWSKASNDWDEIVDDEHILLKPKVGTVHTYSAPVRNSKGEIFARLWMFQDITEQKKLQEGLQQAQKMEAIGRLAGGVAHDFNNLLTGIIGNLQMAELSNEAGTEGSAERGAHCLKAARKAGGRAADLVKQLLGFSRRSHLELSHADANEVIRDVNDLLKASIDPRVQVNLNLRGDLWGVKIDSTQMEQVVMNMCVNSRDAIMESGKGGTITLKTRNQTILEDEEDLSRGERAGDFVVISVADDGAGIPADVIEKIFEPFFTTKEQGKGTGLGLATSFGIVQQHGGWLHCQSQVGKGTIFDIFLPRQEAEKVRKVKIEGMVAGGDETILLIDDESMVRAVAEGFLKFSGYKILEAENGLEGLRMLKEHGSEIDLVLLDMTMPYLTGDETFARIRKEIGDVPVIVCSGYVVDLDEFGSLAGCRPEGFVQKPYSMKSLMKGVREVLDAHLTAEVSQ
jgi:two-component system cell cycle sensor histidine kinase/response regulator CckA